MYIVCSNASIYRDVYLKTSASVVLDSLVQVCVVPLHPAHFLFILKGVSLIDLSGDRKEERLVLKGT